MSVVSGITLQISCAEDSPDDDSDMVVLIGPINDWLFDRNFGPMTALTPHFGGNKHPQVFVYGAGFNHFPEDDFAAFVLSQSWIYPEEVVLLINPECGATRVFRPTDVSNDPVS